MIISAIGSLAVIVSAVAAPRVEVLHFPDHPLQPRIALRGDAIHLAYLTGDARHSDVQYRSWTREGKAFSDPTRVNSQPGSAIAAGSVRGCALAVEPTGKVHIVWNGSDSATPRKQGAMTEESAPLCYTHSDDGKAFTPQQSVMQSSWSLDGGASIAFLGGPAVPAGSSRLAIVWHAADAAKPQGEQNRGIFIAYSTDHGQTFAKELRQPDATDGACACCGLHAFSDNTGQLGILYRRAFKDAERDETLLIQRSDSTWNRTRLDPWPANACPMTTCDAFVLKDGVLLAWETQGQVWVGKWNGELIQTMTAAPGKPEKRKHPRVAALPSGEVLLAWTEGTAWDKGGSVAWQQFDTSLKPMGAPGRAEDLPPWGTPAVMPRSDHFVLLY